MITTTAPGKIHLMGEHAVVFGKPALLAAIDRRCTVSLLPSMDDTIRITSKNLNKTVSYSQKQIEQLVEKAKLYWEKFSNKSDFSLIASVITDDMDYPAIAIGEALTYFQKGPTGFHLTIDSEIPLGSGLGSSAALSVAITATLMNYFTGGIDKEIVNKIAFHIEQKKHGMPSGGDNTVSCFGGVVRFQQDASLKQTFIISDKVVSRFLLVDSGRPIESTGEMVSRVRSLQKEKRRNFAAFLKGQERITQELLNAAENGDKSVGRLLTAGERNLEKIGVVSADTQSLISLIEKSGGAAKICGAGGSQKGSGMLLAYHQEKEVLKKMLQAHKISHYDVLLGSEGVRSN